MSHDLMHGLQHVGIHLTKEISKDPQKAIAAIVTGATVAAPYVIGAAAIAGAGYLLYKIFE